MKLTYDAIENLQSHWAYNSICKVEQNEVVDLTKEKLVQTTVGQQFKFNFPQRKNSSELLEKAKVSYEYAVVEGLNELCKENGDKEIIEQAVASSYMAFEILSLEEVPEDADEKFNFVLKLAALGYFSDRSADLRRWFNENRKTAMVPNVDGMTWDQRLKFQIFDCWMRLFRKEGWTDLNEVSEIVVKLRKDQKNFESEYLVGGSEQEKSNRALRLAALYNLARITELVAEFTLNGIVSVAESVYPDPIPSIEKHFEAAISAADMGGEVQFSLIFRYLHAAVRIMVNNSLWTVANRINSKTSELVRSLTGREHRAMYELLPTQLSALLEHNLLNPAKTAIAIDLPTSGGKTLLAEFRILQALNQFQNERGWIAYVVPTRALASQITRNLRRDLEPIGIRIEQLTAAVEVDSFEEKLLSESKKPFDILVATPEKLSLLIKNSKVEKRPLALAVIDEAHNIESEGRGMRLEFLLAVIRRDCPRANFLALLPNAEDIEPLAEWLSVHPNSDQSISLGTTPWKPNERMVGLFSAVEEKGSNWHLQFEPLTITGKAMPLKGKHQVGKSRPFDIPKSNVLSKGRQNGLSVQTAAIAKEMCPRGTSIAVCNRIPDVWKMASRLHQELPELEKIPEEIILLQEFLRVEFGPNLQLIKTLEKGVGVHHSGLSDDVRTLVEWLAETGKLKVLCATTTIAQGLNFPVASVFLQTHKFQYGKEMTPREFWNLAGRAGRIGHDSVGVIGIASGRDPKEVREFVSRNTGALVSQLVVQLDRMEEEGKLANLSEHLWEEQWEDFRCYIAHLLTQKKNLDSVISDTEQFLKQTYGFTSLRNSEDQSYKAEALLKAARDYAEKISKWRGVAELSDLTGFTPEGVRDTIRNIRESHPGIEAQDWNSERLFSKEGKMAELYNVMLNVPQLNRKLKEIGGSGFKKTRLAEITLDWINGNRIDRIAKKHFTDPEQEKDDDRVETDAITKTCKAIHGSIVNMGSWGLSALSQCSGLDFNKMSEAERNRINLLPAMIYHGVNTEEAVLMRMNSVPRSSAPQLGNMFRKKARDSASEYSVGSARDFLKDLSEDDWKMACPKEFKLKGRDYKRLWQVLAGESLN